MKLFLATITSATLIGTTACMDQGMGRTTSGAGSATAEAPADPTPTTAMPFVAMAGASDLFEIQSSQLALQKAATPAVRDFAQMMIQHHQMTTQQVEAAARSAGLNPPPPQLMPMQTQMIAELQPLSGAEFDRVYTRQQVRAHQMALALHSTYARSGDTPSLKQVAATARPIVQQHLDRARGLRG
jgi:putative membrane protein